MRRRYHENLTRYAEVCAKQCRALIQVCVGVGLVAVSISVVVMLLWPHWREEFFGMFLAGWFVLMGGRGTLSGVEKFCRYGRERERLEQQPEMEA